MRIETATERLLPGEACALLSVSHQPYGRTFCARLFGHRVIVDFITRPRLR